MPIAQDDKDFWLNTVKDAVVQKDDGKVTPSSKKVSVVVREKQYYASKQEFSTYSKSLQEQPSGIDKSLLRRFKREEFAIEACLDLHGSTEDEAFPKVRDFIVQCYGQGKRCVVIVTGKGNRHLDEDDFMPHGVLRQSVPQWLDMPNLRAMILVYKNPSEKLGGNGALYILLRRNKEIRTI